MQTGPREEGDLHVKICVDRMDEEERAAERRAGKKRRRKEVETDRGPGSSGNWRSRTRGRSTLSMSAQISAGGWTSVSLQCKHSSLLPCISNSSYGISNFYLGSDVRMQA
jgi:hypothetical protein